MIPQVQEALKETREELINHPLYKNLNTIEDLKSFTEYHVFAVWDFMSLLKGLQRQLTCVELPWVPTANPRTRRFINEIVFGEETDVDQDGVVMSHYEMYLEAMKALDANTTQIEAFVSNLMQGDDLITSLNNNQVEESIVKFVNFTFQVIELDKPHILAAVFTFGREDLIPDMFIEIVKGLKTKGDVGKLVYYLERHIELDGDEHGPLSLQMVSELCGTDQEKWNEVIQFSKKALEQRLQLWDAICKTIQENKEVLV